MKEKKLKLNITHPELCKEWDYERNLKEFGLKPENITYGSEKFVWWICQKYPNEDRWLTSPNRRTSSSVGLKQTNCPFCSGHRVNNRTCLATTHPEIAKQWHPTLNGSLTPDDVSYGSGIKVWWQCPTYVEDVYFLLIKDKVKQNNCSICDGNIVNNRNCLATTHPEIAKEWHPTLNNNLTPFNVSFGSEKRAWWLCKNNHKYDCIIGNRTNINVKCGCPYCSFKNQTMIYEFLEENNFNFENNFKIKINKNNNFHHKIDFYLLDYNLFVEYDGEQHFRPVQFGGISLEKATEKFIKQQNNDQLKNKFCQKNNINILRIDGRKYQGHKLEEYLKNEFMSYILYYIILFF